MLDTNDLARRIENVLMAGGEGSGDVEGHEFHGNQWTGGGEAKVTLTENDAQECLYKMQIVSDEPDLQESYGISQTQADELVKGIPHKGGDWNIPGWGKKAVTGEMQDHAKVLRGIAEDARKSNETGQALRIHRQAGKFEKIFDVHATLASRINLVLAEDSTAPSSPNQKHAAAAVLRAARLVSVGNWLAAKMQERVALLQKQVVKDITQHAQGFGEATLPSLFAEYERAVNACFDWMHGELADDLKELSGILCEHNSQAVSAHFGSSTAATTPSDISALNILGAPLADHLDKVASDTLFRLKAETRKAVDAGCTAAETVKRLGLKIEATVTATIRAGAPIGNQNARKGGFNTGDLSTVEAVKQAIEITGKDNLKALADKIQNEGLKEPELAMEAAARRVVYDFRKSKQVSASLATRIENVLQAKLPNPLSAINIGVNLFDATDNSLMKFLQAVMTEMAVDADDESADEVSEKRMGYTWVSAADGHVCFPKGEKVLTPHGYRNIEKIKVGDVVIGGSRQPRRVIATSITSTKQIATIILENGQTIRCTPNHLFLVGNGWIKAKNLEGKEIAKCATCVNIDAWLKRSVNLAERHSSQSRSAHSAAGLVTSLITQSRKTSSFASDAEKSQRVIISKQGLENSAQWSAAPNFTNKNSASDHALIAEGDFHQDENLKMELGETATINTVQPNVEQKQWQRTKIGNGKSAMRLGERKTRSGLVEKERCFAVTIAGQIGKNKLIKHESGTGINVAVAEVIRKQRSTFTTSFPSVISTITKRPTSCQISNRFVSNVTKSERRNLSNTRCFSFCEAAEAEATMATGENDIVAVNGSTRQSLPQLMCFTSEKNYQGESQLASNWQNDLVFYLPQSATLRAEKLGGTCKVKSVVISEQRCAVFDISVEHDHSFIVADVVAHNCDFCEFMDGGKWDADKEPVDDSPELESEPPAHFGCRCSLLPVDLDGEFPSGDFSDYLAHYSGTEQREAFGADNLNAYRRGEMTPAQLMGQQTNRIPLDKFRDMSPVTDEAAAYADQVAESNRQLALGDRARQIREQLGLPEPAEAAP